MTTHLFGIRHHGPGSARSLCRAIEALQPDIVLVEGPPDASSVLPLIADAQMRPPVALLIYAPDNPQRSVYYPFAVFSPEWQAISYAFKQQIPVCLMDLPQTHRFALDDSKSDEAAIDQPDPLTLMAQAAGYDDSERWWEHLVEQRQDSRDLFAAILEAMTALRTEASLPLSPTEAYREAYMRKTIREAEKEGFQRIAVVCGAWHAPALAQMPPAKEDNALLKGLPKLKVEATWVPWTHRHLLRSSGYGAGIESPGWYQHLWEQSGDRAGRTMALPPLCGSDSSIRWMTRIARLLRKQDLDASSASVIEAVRLAETLAALRDRSLAGLPELNEATQTVLCFGDALPMQLIHNELIVGDRLGKVPSETPLVPLQQDLRRQQQRLRLKSEAVETTMELDLRKPLDLDRSHFLHRLDLLNLPWGKSRSVGNAKGTFRESWQLQWQPEFATRLIEMGIWGNTIELATIAWVGDRANRANLPDLTSLIDRTLLANLPPAILHLMTRLQSEAALSSDITHLMAALPPLVNVMRYGTVRQFETAIVSHVVDGLIVRICVGLPIAAVSLDDDAAASLYQQVIAVNGSIALLQQSEALEMWQNVLAQMADQQGLHGLLAGRCCRLLFEAGRFDAADAARRLSLALSIAAKPAPAAAWLEGFLAGSGLLLLHNPALWNVIDDWVSQLADEPFMATLPLLRRTFATFPAPERRQMGDRVRQGERSPATSDRAPEFDVDRADAVLPLVAQLLGVSG